MSTKKLPIGISDFRKVIEEDFYYVDKSMFIKEIIDNGSESILLPRPRRFGKTLNLSMLRYFYEKSEEDTGRFFHHLNIWRQGEVYVRKQGRHPVIFLTFKDVKCDNWEECEAQLKRVIRDEYRRHDYLLEHVVVKSPEKEEYQAILDLSADKTAYENSIKQLSAWLHQYHGQKAIILIDEYDTPIQGGFVNGYYSPIIGFMRNMLSGALKDNSHLEKGVLTGILSLCFRSGFSYGKPSVPKESIFSGLNNLEVCSLLSPKFSHSFGLLEHEVERMLQDYGAGLDIGEVKRWYNGYMFGDTVIYNPWSILHVADKWRDGMQPYWVNTSSNDLIRQIISHSGASVKQDLEILISGGSIRKTVEENVVFGEIENSSDTVWSFLLMSGYLKIKEKQWIEGVMHGELAIPNKEVEYLYRQIILGWFNQSIYSDHYHMMLKGLVNGDLVTFEEIFREFVLRSFSYFDTANKEAEKVYHAFVLGLLLGLNDTHEVKSNRESGLGRYDVMLIPKNPAQQGIIIEFKKANSFQKETLEAAAEAALKQIRNKGYAQELVDRGIRSIVQLGIAFHGKEVHLVAAEMKLESE